MPLWGHSPQGLHSIGADDYVRRCHGALHTIGDRYILEDVDGYISNAAGK